MQGQINSLHQSVFYGSWQHNYYYYCQQRQTGWVYKQSMYMRCLCMIPRKLASDNKRLWTKCSVEIFDRDVEKKFRLSRFPPFLVSFEKSVF